MSDLRNTNIGPFSMIDAGFIKTRMEFNDPREEERYQAFKERLMDELVAERPAQPILGDPCFTTPAEHFPLVSKERK